MTNTQTKRPIFNPVKEETDGVRSRRVVWSSASFEIAVDALVKGKRLIANPFVDGNIKLRKPDLVYERTVEEIEEWKKCRDDIAYFVEKYCKIMTPEGVKHVKLRDYQLEYLQFLKDNRYTIFVRLDRLVRPLRRPSTCSTISVSM